MNIRLWIACSLVIACLASTGCATLKAFGEAATNPHALMLAYDGSPLTVVVQRADAASATADQVERLLTATPIGDDAAWVQQTPLSEDVIAARTEDMATHPYYRGKSYNVVEALIWADHLANIKSTEGSHTSLLAAISPELEAGFVQLQAKRSAVAGFLASIQSEKDAYTQENIPVAERTLHEAKIVAFESELDRARDDIEAQQQAFVASCRGAAAKTPVTVRKQFALPITSLLKAVHDAQLSNRAATAGYPKVVVDAVGSIRSQLLDVVKSNVSDYVFERTGKRLKLDKLQAQAKFENGHVTLALNEITPEDLGAIGIDELIAETIARTERFAERAGSLLFIAGATHDKLSFQEGVLDGIKEGFAVAETMPAAEPPTTPSVSAVAQRPAPRVAPSVSFAATSEVSAVPPRPTPSVSPVAIPYVSIAVQQPATRVEANIGMTASNVPAEVHKPGPRVEPSASSVAASNGTVHVASNVATSASASLQTSEKRPAPVVARSEPTQTEGIFLVPRRDSDSNAVRGPNAL